MRLPRFFCGLLALLAVLSLETPTAGQPGDAQRPVFRFNTDGFWLNLHHFLYVLGCAEAEMSDIERRAVAQAPEDQERGLQTLPPEQQQLWRGAVSIYARGPSQLDSVFDDELVTATANLVDAGESIEGVEIDVSWASALQQAAPVYRRVWWPEHQAANRAWVEAIEPLLEKHGKASPGSHHPRLRPALAD